MGQVFSKIAGSDQDVLAKLHWQEECMRNSEYRHEYLMHLQEFAQDIHNGNTTIQREIHVGYTWVNTEICTVGPEIVFLATKNAPVIDVA